jgi:hypothetical protein
MTVEFIPPKAQRLIYRAWVLRVIAGLAGAAYYGFVR